MHVNSNGLLDMRGGGEGGGVVKATDIDEMQLAKSDEAMTITL